MVNSYDDLAKIYGKINPEVINEALIKSEARMLDIESGRKAVKSQASNYIKWVGGCWVLVLSAAHWAHKTNYDVILAGCLVILILLGIAIFKVFGVFGLQDYPGAGTSPSFWLSDEILTGDLSTLCFMRARILVEHYSKSIVEGEKSYTAMCDKFSSSQAFATASFLILVMAVFIQVTWLTIVRFFH
jgi:hypothetical protein